MGELGTRYKCFKCESKFYDLNRPEPICPSCGEDQSNKEAKQLFTKKKRWPSRMDTDMHVLPEDSDALSESVDADSLTEVREDRDEYLIESEGLEKEEEEVEEEEE